MPKKQIKPLNEKDIWKLRMSFPESPSLGISGKTKKIKLNKFTIVGIQQNIPVYVLWDVSYFYKKTKEQRLQGVANELSNWGWQNLRFSEPTRCDGDPFGDWFCYICSQEYLNS